jgi:hypothetical protein
MLLEVYRKLRPGDPATMENARTLVYNLSIIPAGMIWGAWAIHHLFSGGLDLLCRQKAPQTPALR